MAGQVRMGGAGEWQPRVRQVARRARRLVRLHGAGWFVALVVLTALGLGCGDYWLRYEDPGVRLICSIVLGLVVVWSGYRDLWGAWRYRCPDLQAARRIEARFPSLGDVVSSAVAFGAQPAEDDTAGSWELRRAVMARAAAALGPVDCDACLNRRRPLCAVALAVAMLAVVLTLGLVNPSAVGLAARHLLQPWRAEAWPRRHLLVFTTAPARVAAGQDVEVEVIDAHGRLPDIVQIHYWFDGDDASSVETHTMQPLGDRLTYRLPHVTRGLRYRATGGDDQRMAWRELQVVEPIRLVAQELRLTPPAYAGLPSRTATGDFRALQGTRVDVHLRVNKRLRAARLETTTMGTSAASLPLQLDEDRRGGTLAPAAGSTWEVERSGAYGFQFIDEDELESGTQDRWEATMIPDLPPVVTLRQPTGDLLLTTRATVTLAGQVADDLAIRAVALDFHTVRASAPGAPQRVELWSGPPPGSPIASPAAGGEGGARRDVSYDWDLSHIPGLEPGVELEYRLVAEDYRPQEGAGTPRRIRILSPEELDERLMQRQTEIFAEMAEVARMQQQNSDQTGQLAAALRGGQRPGRPDIDQLQGTELNQRQIAQRLVHPADGLAAQVGELRRDLERNRVDNVRMVRQLQRLEAALQELGDTLLTRIEQQLLAALKAARDGEPDDAPPPPANADPVAVALAGLVAAVQADQVEVVRRLDQWLGELSQWDAFQRLTRDVGRLRQDQETLRQRTDQLRAATLSKNVRELPEEARADVSRLAEQQLAMARRWEAWSDRLREADAPSAATTPPAANPVAAARQLLEQTAIGGGMRDVARDVSANRLGQAVDRQREIIRQLQRVQELLTQRDASSPSAMAARLAALAADIPPLAAQQQRLEQQTRALDQVRPGPDARAVEAWGATRTKLAHEQVAVGEAIREHERRNADLASLASMFQSAAEAAAEAVGRLRADDAGPVTWDWQQQVSRELQQVLAVLTEAATAPPAVPPTEPAAATAAARDVAAPGDPTLLLQLQVVRTVQQELHRRTTALAEALRAAPGWDAQQTRGQQVLARRQDRLAEVLTRLSGLPTVVEMAPAGAFLQPAPASEAADHGPPPPDASALDQQLLDDPLAAGGPNTGGAAATTETSPDAAATTDPLRRIAGQMRAVARRIRGRDVAEPTQVAQRRIIQALTEAIDARAAHQAATSAGDALAERAARPDPSRADSAVGSQQAARDAAPPSADGATADARLADLPRAAQDVWGQLPERCRRQVQSVDAVEFLPAYRTLIEDYYRRLSERRGRRP